METCPKCGAIIDSHWKFCTLCNQKLRNEEAFADGNTISDAVIMNAEGIGGTLSLLKDRIRISRKGLGSLILQGFKGDKDIYLSQISSIQLKKAGGFTNGYIQFSFLGGQETKGGIFDATQDENTIMFKPSQQAQFLLIKQEIDKRISQLRNGSNVKASSLDELEKLASLKDKGIITEEEFKYKKKQILGL